MLSALAVVAGQVVKGTVGFGAALVSVPVLTWVWGPADGLALGAICDVASSAVLLRESWRQVLWVLVAALAVPMIVVQYVATGVLADLDPTTFRLALGVVIAVFGLDMVLRPVRPGIGELTALPERPGTVLSSCGLAGTVAGVLSGLFGTPGPPLVLAVRRYFVPAVARATLLAVLAPGAVTLAIALYWRGSLEQPGTIGLTALGMMPLVALGSLAGAWLSHRISVRASARAVGAVLVAAGGVMVLTM